MLNEDCCVYWIRDPEHTDVFTEGYVGVTSDLRKRVKSHVRNAFKGDYYLHRTYKKHLKDEDFVVEKLLIAPRWYCLEIEYKLRPERYVGWNTAIGGEHTLRHSQVTHGLSGTKASKVFASFRGRHEITYHPWRGDDGVANFNNWWNSLDATDTQEDKVCYIIERSKGIHPDNIGFSDSRRGLWGRNLYSKVENKSMLLAEWAESLNTRQNTIATRLARGWSVDEALGLCNRKTDTEDDYKHDPDKLMCIYYLENTAMTHNVISKLVGYRSTLRRVLHKFNLPKYLFDFCDVPDSHGMFAYRIPRQYNQNLTSFSVLMDIKDSLDCGESVNSIANRYCVHNALIKNLEWSFDNAKIV